MNTTTERLPSSPPPAPPPAEPTDWPSEADADEYDDATNTNPFTLLRD